MTRLSARFTEADLGRCVQAWLEAQGWTVYTEVALYDGFIDIVARREAEGETLLWIVECKTRLNWDVLDQACARRHYADFCSVATPLGRAHHAQAVFFDETGIGHIKVSSRFDDASVLRVDDAATVTPKRNGSGGFGHYREQLLRMLRPEHLERNIAPGVVHGNRVTAFSITCDNLRKYVESNPCCTMRHAVQRIEHHYGSTASARNALLKWIRAGKVPGVRAEDQRGRTVLVVGDDGRADGLGTEWDD